MSTTLKTLTAVFVIALVLRLITFACLLPTLRSDVDMDSYHSLARSLAEGKGFLAEAPDGRVLSNVARTPVYPLFLAGLIRTGGDQLSVFLVVQCVVGALTCGLTFLIARRWLRSGPAALAGFLVAIDPNSIVRCSDLRTETLFTLLLVCAVWLMVWRPDKNWGWFVAGFLWSLAALTRPIAVWIWVAALVMALVQHVPWRSRILYLAAFLAGFVPLIAVWAARNHAVTGRYFVSSISSYNLLMYRAAGVEAQNQGRELEEVQRQMLARCGDIQFVEDRVRFQESLAAYQQTAIKILGASPLVFAKQTAVGWAKLLFGPGAHALDNARDQGAPVKRSWSLVYIVALVAVVSLSVVGAWRLGRQAILPVLLTLYFVGLAGGPESNSRFRVPMTPLLAILAAAGIPETKARE